ncbi:MAG TPA: DUF47 family protein [Candidatus Deferrimicrobium sp.]|nr:DUF47 family protein [Candidatus Deferrimicrobium sp.]
MAFGSTRNKEIRVLLRQLVDEPMAQCAILLSQFFEDRANREALLRAIIELEHRGDHLVAEAYGMIDRSFITWIDKRDLTNLLDALDEILDRMREAAQQADIYRITTNMDEARQLTAVICAMTDTLQLMVKELEKLRIEPLIRPAAELQRLEHQADDIRYGALRRLYPQGHGGTVLCEDRILWILETVTDNCNHAAKVMISIARKAG